jgi:hypothetical protein
MAEEATTTEQDVSSAGEITTDIFADEAEDTAAAESSTKETKSEAETKVEEPTKGTETEGEESSEEADKADKSDEGTEDAAAEEEAQTEDENTEETETDQPKPRSAEARKEELNKEIREKLAERDAIRKEIADLNSQHYQPRSEEQLVEEGMDEAEARATAAEERMKIAEFNSHVANVTTNLEMQSLQVMSEFPEFDPESDQYNPDLTRQAQGLYARVAGLKVDQKTGMVYDAAVFPYDIYKEIALTHRAGAKSGQVQGQKSTEKMLQRAETPTSSAPKAPKKSELEALWDE